MIHIIDLNYLERPHTIAAFVIESDEGPILVETGPHSTFSALTAGLKTLGYSVSDVKHVLLTHIHLDHAGAAWALAEQGATVYLHPFGFRHMADPSKLYASAKRIYQADMDRLWGDLRPIPEGQLRIVDHLEKIEIGNRTITAHHTPGHATHHIAWQVGKDLFSGDVAGCMVDGLFVQPPCPPPDINLQDWEKSISHIKTLGIERIFLTHFGIVRNIESHLAALEKCLWEWANWIKPYVNTDVDLEKLTADFQAFTNQQLIEAGAGAFQLDQYDAANPAWMSVAGLMRYWKKLGEQK